ncbi:MAG: hypothetical protein A2900_02640 [Candidatus Chisholmbacteria bacterium RIFCSPLOWO2_01_FULL_50_28]|uniref:Mur ligase central domain-containing protein n=1 Tax=Candidatus Chisholmbacteria bacterium RIFCSPHIGHO2_01_FULL_52_32 TaxID=1797591 RepID=A0A1G1VTK8_9BACT|nr:MAG: hypothetical protein A2786_04105 [Candidatus Chisholmbacteria bacterium RIFCSPHIGHO2_01_FULL_52_32]OGY19976.1 MAG: hypothetical protein A2900_02640 [Candidatus Chisholmbacteria bacterium RIFCSPLOWO2_01_FULL_50_28]
MLKRTIAFLLLIYFRELAKLQLRKASPTIIGITGSAGKTSLRNAIAAVLKDHRKIKVSLKANSESGIPLNILGLSPKDYSFFDWARLSLLAPITLLTNWEPYDVYIAELGIDSPLPPKNMEYLLTIVRPAIGVFLNVLPVHGQFFDGLVPQTIKDPKERRARVSDAIAEEKGKLITSLPKTGVAILNADDPKVIAFFGKTKARVVTFGVRHKADLMAKDIGISLGGFSMVCKEDAKEEVKLKLGQLFPKHYAQTFLAAIAVGRYLGLSLAQCVRGLQTHFQLPKGRMSIIPGIRGTVILDSSYNASRKTMEDALQTLREVAPQRKIAILGDMRELGSVAKLEHEEVAKIAARTTDMVVTVGPQMKQWFTPELIKLGFPRKNLWSATGPYEALDIAKKLMKDKDTVLIKGSQNALFLEIVTQGLMQNPKDANKLLCRRGRFWDGKREQLKQSER